MQDPPAWLAQMANELAIQIYGVDILSPLGCHYYHNRALNQWEVSLFAASTETVGGSQDGRVLPCRFTADLLRIAETFSQVTSFSWQPLALGSDDEIGPHISLEGHYQGHFVWLRLLAKAPERFQTGRLVRAYELKLEDVW